MRPIAPQSPRVRQWPTQRSAANGSRKRERFEVQRPAFMAQDDGVLAIKAVQLIDTRPALDGFVWQAFLVLHRLLNALTFLDLVRINLHNAAAAVGQQQIIFTVLLIDD